MHTIGFHDATDGHMICHGTGAECAFANTQFKVSGPEATPPPIDFACEDGNTGNYTCAYDITNAGTYQMAVTVNGAMIGDTKPFIVDVNPGPVTPSECEVYGTGLFDGVAGDMRYLTIVARDKWANDRVGIGEPQPGAALPS